MSLRGYFDWNATAPLRPEVAEAMAEAWRAAPGNPSSLHRHGVEARFRLEKARRQIARMLGTAPECLLFTGGGSEAINLALRGAAFAMRREQRGNRIATSAADHRAVLDTCRALAHFHRFALSIVPVDAEARVSAEALGAHLGLDTGLVSLLLANNEVGSLNFSEVHSRTVRDHAPRAVLHLDAIQALGKMPLAVESLGADLVSFAAHKVGGPRSVGLLWRRPGVSLEPQLTGGGQEQGLRAGTEDVAGAVGFARALELALSDLAASMERLEILREALWEHLRAALPGAIRNSPAHDALANTLNVSFPGVPSRAMVQELDRRGFAVSSGSACSSEGGAPSHVMLAMTSDEARAASAIRFSLGGGVTAAEIEELAQACAAAVAALGQGAEVLK